ncbi:AzlD domain-containing protein [Chitinimonas sp.]|uniref:AzlD domain-containing protein n=1 Tax=Chitinimonas sp. TaxID=1934313 RepID=UPI0035B15147
MNLFEVGLIGGMTLITFAIRYTFFALGERLRFPPRIRQALRFVPVAVLTAITVPMVLLPADGAYWGLHWRNAWLVGALLSALIAWRYQHLLAAIASSMTVYFIWRWLFN